MVDSTSWSLRSSLGRHSLFGALTAVGFVGGLVAWSATTEVAGAVVAGGTVVVDGGIKAVQHQEGGIVREILVDDEQTVAAGQVLLRLDGTAIAANLEVVVGQLRAALARQARLIAEGASAPVINLPASAQDWTRDAELARLLGEQDRLLERRVAARASRLASTNEQIRQLQLQIEGLGRQRASVEERLAIADDDFAGIDQLFTEGLVVASRRSALEREQSDLAGQVAQIDSMVAQVSAAIAAQQLMIAQENDEYQATVIEELQSTNEEVARLMQQKIAAEDRLSRLDITAPIDGIVHESMIHTIGGVIQPGERLMSIVPRQLRHTINARLNPLDIDKLVIGQDVRIKLSGLDPKTTPELFASVRSVSPDLLRDAASGVQYYMVRVDIPDDQVARLPDASQIVPGMPAEVFLQTGQHSVLAYLMKPFADQLGQAFREQ